MKLWEQIDWSQLAIFMADISPVAIVAIIALAAIGVSVFALFVVWKVVEDRK